ncbi:aminopeptidase [Saccharibacillus sp. CPCC 101409]|uniref:aminopeptidase n=1 Tax=Saccharibacillus sp. CPCC 101409 TaxID=3058041 RepID=UPI0026713A7C|nr:aminopeptidase [Saccharibacillus sp. CPCC 101409]MDO3408167.1 aminopeptidase [Saccharibacillus sp. CPCC 101409]
MTDPRLKQLARTAVGYSTNVQPGEKVLIRALDVHDFELLAPFIDEIHRAGGLAFIDIGDYATNRRMMLHGSEEQFRIDAALKLEQMKQMDAVVILLGENNVSEYADVPADKREAYTKIYRPVVDEQVRKKWVLFNYPTKAYAQLAEMSTDTYTQFLYDTCTMDYSRMSAAMEPLTGLLNKTERVRIVAPGTDLSFSVKGIPAVKCDGKVNLPDGEVYTAPVRDSVNGTIAFNTRAAYMGQSFSDVSFTFERGRIVSCRSDNDIKLNELLDTDEGARYIGEFALGVNPYVNRVMNDIGFDEKINGSIHFALGKAYDNADNGNSSAIHWDIVLLLKEEFGGGEIYFDDVLVSKNGRFVVEELSGLNPEMLV